MTAARRSFPRTGKESTGFRKRAGGSATAERRDDLPRLSTGEKPYIVRTGDNYARIAAAEGVDEGDLRQINRHVDIGPGLILKIPPKRIVAEEPPEVAAIREQIPQRPRTADWWRPWMSTTRRAPSSCVRNSSSQAAPAASGNTYVVQPGESIFRIASRYKVSQDALMRANGITIPARCASACKLVIPAN